MKTIKLRSVLFLLFGLFFLYLSLIAFRSLSPDFREQMFAEPSVHVHCEAFGCLSLAQWDVGRMKNNKMTGETVALCQFHRWKIRDPLYVPEPVKSRDIIAAGVLFLFTSLLFFFPGIRLGYSD